MDGVSNERNNIGATPGAMILGLHEGGLGENSWTREAIARTRI